MEPWKPSRTEGADGQVTLGHPLVDEYLELVRARWRRNTLLATAFDLKVFFSTVGKGPLDVTTADVLGFLRAQRRGPGKVVRMRPADRCRDERRGVAADRTSLLDQAGRSSWSRLGAVMCTTDWAVTFTF